MFFIPKHLIVYPLWTELSGAMQPGVSSALVLGRLLNPNNDMVPEFAVRIYPLAGPSTTNKLGFRVV